MSSNKFKVYLQMEQFSAMTDAIHSGIPPMEDGKNGRKITIFNDSTKRVSKVYEDLMQWSVVVDTKLDPKVEKKLDSMRNKLFKIKKVKNEDFDPASPIDDLNKPELFHSFISPMYAKYIEYEMKYYDAVEKNNEIRVAAENGDTDAMTKISIDGKNMKKREESALKAWQSLGYKESVERIQNYLSEIEEKHMLVIKKRLQNEFRNSQRTRIIDYTNYSPAIPVSANALRESKNWPQIKLGQTDVHSDYSKSVHNWGAAAAFSMGIFSIGGSGGGNHQKVKSNLDISSVKISFKVGKVRVERGWYSGSFVESRYWKLHENSPQNLNGDIISDGKGGGLMPNVITELILATDVSIDFSESSTSFSWAKDKLSANTGIGIGPFVFGGNYSYENTNSKKDYHWEGKSLKSPGITVLGYKLHITPKSPNPNPEIKLWTDGKE